MVETVIIMCGVKTVIFKRSKNSKVQLLYDIPQMYCIGILYIEGRTQNQNKQRPLSWGIFVCKQTNQWSFSWPVDHYLHNFFS